MSILLSSKVVRLALNAASYAGITDQLTNAAVVFPRADLRIEVAAFWGRVNTTLALVDIANWVSITCTFKAPALSGSPPAPAGSAAILAQRTVLAAAMAPAMTLSQWNDYSGFHAAFDFTEAEVNALPASVWCVFTALLDTGKVIPIQFGLMQALEDGHGIADPEDVVDGTAYSKSEANALFVKYAGGAYHKFADGYFQVRDKITGNWRGLFLEAGVPSWTAENPGPAPSGDLWRIAGNFVQIGDTITGGWRSLWLENGVPTWGDEEAV